MLIYSYFSQKEKKSGRPQMKHVNMGCHCKLWMPPAVTNVLMVFRTITAHLKH